MLKTIIYREFLSNIITFRFLLGLLVCVSLVGTNTYVLLRNYEAQLQSYHQAIQTHTTELHNIEVLSDLSYRHRPKVDKMPRLTSILSQGVSERLGNSVEVSYNLAPVRATPYDADNPYLAMFRRIDLALVVQIVLSLLAFLFAYDAIAGEREDGTLSLTLSNAISRNTLLIGKYLGGMLSLSVPLLISLLVGLQVILFSPHIIVTIADWGRIALFCVVSLVYVSVFYTLGLIFSSRTSRSATALMLVMFFWVVFVLIWPNVSAFVVSKVVPVRSDADLSIEIENLGGDRSKHRVIALWNQYQREIKAFAQKRGVTETFFSGTQYIDFNFETMIGNYIGPPEKLSLFHEYLKFREELRIEYADKVARLWSEYLEEYSYRQARLAQNIARISPTATYAHATAILAETDLDSHLQFLMQAEEYQNTLIQYLRDRNAFASEAWYRPEALKQADKEGLPLFRERGESLSSSVRRATGDLLILMLLNVVFFLLAHASFLRYEVK